VLIVDPDSTSCLDFISMTCENVPIVFSEEVVNTFEKIENLAIDSTSITVLFDGPLASDQYILNVNLYNEIDRSMYGIIVTEKSEYGFTVQFSSPLDSINYKLSWSVNTEATLSGTYTFDNGSDYHRVNFIESLSTNDYAIATAMVNEIDVNPSIYNFVVTEKDANGFAIKLADAIDSTSYELDWNVYDSTSFVPNGTVQISQGITALPVDIDDQLNDKYSLALSIINTVDVTSSIYSYLVTQKNSNNFTIQFSSPIDSTNYYLSWAITDKAEEESLYRQESGFRLFDTMGRFDCSHGFDIVEIYLETVSQEGVIIQENEGWILQEAAIDPNDNEYGLLLE
jgi:methionine-rich copper-binding protein CopC